MSGNSVTVVGNITRDPELRFTPSGQARATFGLAVNRRWQNRQTQDWEEQVSFFNVTCWGDLGDNVSESLTKGSRVLVTGRLEQRSWETPEGDKRSVVEIVADEVGPSLRWATAQVTKTERRSPDGSAGGNNSGGNNSGGGGAGRQSANSSSGGGSGGGGNSGSGNSGGDYGYDEEPF